MATPFSRRTDWPTHLNPIAQALEKKRAAGDSFIDLTDSNPTRCEFVSLKENPKYSPDPRGLLKARESVCRYYAEKKIRVMPEQVFLTASTSEAYSFIFRLMTDPGDGLLVPRPSYPLLDYLCSLSDLTPRGYPLVYEDRWRIDTQSLGALFDAKTRGLIVVNPNNPTGNFVKKSEKHAINALCGKDRRFVVSDEVFFDFALRAGDRVSFAGNKEALSFTVSGISKVLGLPQMKLSWIVVSGPPSLRKEALGRLEVIADTFLSVNTPSQEALPKWFRSRERIQREILKRLLSNQQCLEKAFEKSKKACLLKNEGGWHAVLRIDSQKTDETLTLELLEKQNVLVHPGYFFDFDQGSFLTLSLLPPPASFKKGIGRLQDFFSA